MTKLLPIFIVFCLTFTAFGEITPAQEADFIVNLIDDVEWPSGSGNDFVISVIGNPDMAEAISAAVSGKNSGKYNIQVKQIGPEDDFEGSQMVVIAEDDKATLAAVLKQASGKPILTVTNVEGFARYGVMVELIKLDGHDSIEYAVNRMVAKKSNIKISDKFVNKAKKTFG